MVVTAVGMTPINLALPIVPLDIVRSTGNRPAAGIVTAASSLFVVLLELRSPGLLRRFSERRLLLAALAVQALALLGLALFRQLPAMLLAGSILGGAFGVVATVTSAAASALAPRGREGEAIGYYGMAASAPTIVAPPLAIVLVTVVGAPAVFAAAAALSAVTVLLAARLPEVAPPPAPAAGGGVFEVLRSWPVFASWLAFICTTTTYGATVSFAPFLLGTSGPASAAVFLLVFALARVFGRAASGRLLRGTGERRLVLGGLLTGALALALVPLHVGLLAVAAAAVYGACFGLVQTGAFVAMLAAAGARSTAAVSGVWNMGVDAGFGAGSLLLAPVGAAFGYTALFWVLPALWLAGLLARLSARPAARDQYL